MFKYCGEVVRSPIESSNSSKPSTSCLNAYKCEICDKGWQSETEVFYHKKEHFKTLKKEKDSNHFCWTCIRKFNTAADLIGHYKMCHLLSSEDAQRVEYEIFVCNICSKVFFNKKMLAIHITHLHKKPKTIRKKCHDCPKCNKKVRGQYIWSHFHFHNMIGLYTCPICFTRLPNWDELKSHMKSHPLYLKCDMCGENFDKKFKFAEHIQKHKLLSEEKDDNDDDEEVKQAIDEYFIPNDSPKDIKYHKLLPYQGLRLLDKVKVCVLCREICTSYKERKQHILYHKKFILYPPELQKNPLERQKYVCSCGEIFMQKILLKQHLMKNKVSEFVHEALSESDIINLMSNPEEYTILEIV